MWGLGLLASFFVAPALLGIHPEIPGTVAPSLEHRQAWWIFCAVFTCVGLLVLYYGKGFYKSIGLVLLVAPHMVGAPIHEQLTFMNEDPEAVTALTELSGQFVLMTTIGMVLFFVPLGALSGIAASRLVRQD